MQGVAAASCTLLQQMSQVGLVVGPCVEGTLGPVVVVW